MQTVILCGGQGTRIRDVAEDIPKPMIPVGNKPILWHIMKRFAKFGLTDFVLCLGHKSAVIKQYFLNYHLAESDFSVTLRPGSPAEMHMQHVRCPENWKITLAETGLESMTGCRIKRIERYITSDNFMVTYGDGLADINLQALLAFHQNHGKIGTVTAVNPPGRFGEMEILGDRVAEFNEKPFAARGWINGGFLVFQRRLFERLEDDPGLVFEQGPLMNLARDGQLMGYKHQGFWHPMDSSRDHRVLNELWAGGRAPWADFEPVSLRVAA